MKRYRIHVVEKHFDFIWVEAENKEEAEEKAKEHKIHHFESAYSYDWTGETEEIEQKE